MSRRRLRVVCSSDEEQSPPPPPQQQEEEIEDIIIDDIDIDFQTVTLNSSNPTPNSNNSTTTNTERNASRPSEPIPLDISDEEEENINSNATNNSNFASVNGDTSYFEVSTSPVNGVLERLGLRVKREWLDSCLHGLQLSVAGFQGLDDSAKAKLCFGQFLFSDMNYCGAGALPPNVHTLHLVDLKGPFVLQVDEIVNISCPLRGRYQNAASGIKRCLKLSMTDGVQRVFGMEYRPIKDLEVLAPAGLKVAICNVNVRHGLLLLVPEALEVLGGTVEELEAARQRLVNEINKPPRGKRNRTGVVPPLASRATLAAWPSRNDPVPENADSNTRSNSINQQASGQGTAVGIHANDITTQAFATPVSRNNTELNMSAARRPREHEEVPSYTDMHASARLAVTGQGTAFGSIPAKDRPRQDIGIPVSRTTVEPSTLSAVKPLECVTTPQHITEPTTEVISPLAATRIQTLAQPSISVAATRIQTCDNLAQPSISANNMSEDGNVRVSRDNGDPDTSSAIYMDVEEISIVDELEHHFILSRDKETPFTYLATLSAKCVTIEDEASMVRGKIKPSVALNGIMQCFLTGVKGFQYKQRATYELRVYVDDGSLISEILIDHSVVQNGIGYSPQEVTSALTSSDTKRVREMKETLKKFQIFLVNFEGTMLVEMNKSCPVPIAVEMNQGCPASDAWLLLKRLKSSSVAQPQNQSHQNPIDLSP
ncbi:recQ-mediated genome instability protein 1 [Sesamum indicum]|uniref:RecQ-mediated genome instability protein 1 n=1 Tax=Sesamum indicum TaxID=4182 RepID=A0A8M8UPC2_SESIN|nr:recQ-mediated genome instability protein 1 [Sesamum indicum]